MAETKTQLAGNMKLDEKEFIETLMTPIIGQAKHLQNNPPALVPKESLVAAIVENYLAPYSGASGPLKFKKFEYVEGRANVMITYPGTDSKKVISFVGSHMDVVPANPEEWEHDPFSLEVKGDQMWGRGVTDCLGHVALISNFFKQLAIQKPKLKHTIVAIFIANEENSDIPGIGIDEMEKRHELDFLKHGPLYWIDSADFGPTLGTGGMLGWQLTVNGKKFHSGVPHKGINSLELAMEVVKYLQERFYKDFSAFAAEEKEYKFAVGSSLKPTQISTPPSSINQIPGQCTVCGDIRYTPFYRPAEVQAKIQSYLNELDVTTLPSFGASRFHLPDENLKGTVELKWLGTPYSGVAVNLKAPGYTALHNGVEKACGSASPFSLTGSLPIIRELQDAGFDVQCTGFGRMSAYHANNEFAYISDYVKGFQVLAHVVDHLESH